MKIILEEKLVDETEVKITCAQINGQVKKLKSYIELYEERFPVKKDGQTIYVPLKNIYYIESVENKTFIYEEKEYYEALAKLYEMEERLDGKDFFRISKSIIVNINMVNTMRPEMNRTILLTLLNGEKLYISRKYAADIKKKLGL